MTVVVFHWIAFETSEWVDPEKMVDGDEETFAHADDVEMGQDNSHNSCPIGVDFPDIIKVEIRAKVYVDDVLRPDEMALIPLFEGEHEGDIHLIEPLYTTPTWSEWFDITNDSNAPDWKQGPFFTDIEDLWLYILSATDDRSGYSYCSKLELRVTYGVLPKGAMQTGKYWGEPI